MSLHRSNEVNLWNTFCYYSLLSCSAIYSRCFLFWSILWWYYFFPLFSLSESLLCLWNHTIPQSATLQHCLCVNSTHAQLWSLVQWRSSSRRKEFRIPPYITTTSFRYKVSSKTKQSHYTHFLQRPLASEIQDQKQEREKCDRGLGGFPNSQIRLFQKLM